MTAETARRLLIIRTNKSLDDLPWWMVRAALAIDPSPSGVVLLVDDDPGAPEPRWEADPTMEVDRLQLSGAPYIFGLGTRHLGIAEDITAHPEDRFVVYGPDHAFNRHRSGV